MPETKLDRLACKNVLELLDGMLNAEAGEITGAVRCERT